MKRFLNELKRREVIKPLLAYLGLSWLILQIVGVVASILVIHPMIGPATLLLLVCGFPVMAYLSWHFDFSVNGLKRTPSLDKDAKPAIEPFGVINWLGLSFIVLISGFIGFQYFASIQDQQLATEEGLNTVKLADSIAVLPFTDQSPEQDQAYLALGLSEEITSLLGRSDGFKVSASRSSQILTDKGLTPVDIGRRLDVSTVLTGSVRATGSRLKVRVELLDTETGHTLWTESFLRELKDIFAIESEIGRAVVNLLQDKYIEAGDFTSLSATSSTDAYVMYLKGREEYRKQTTESMKAARKLFENAVALDPEYAKGYVGLADTLVFLAEGDTQFGVIKTDVAAALAQQNIDKALVRQPQMPEAYAVKGYVSFLKDDFDGAIADFNKAIELNPSLAIAYTWKYLALFELQRFDESLLALETAQKLDPLFQTNTYNFGVELSTRGRFGQAEDVFNQLAIDFPESTFPYEGLADIYFSRGDFVGAIREGLKAAQLSPDNLKIASRLLSPIIQLGLTEIIKEKTDDPFWDASILIFEKKFENLFEKMEFEVSANPEDYWIAFEAGWYHAMLGDKTKAVTLLTDRESLISDNEKLAMPYCSPAIEIAWAYKILGKTENSQKLVNQCRSLLEQQRQSSIKYNELDYLEARIFAFEGNANQSIKALSKAIDNGWREWWTIYDPLFENVKNEAEFQVLIEFVEDDLARQREEALVLFDNEP